MQVFTGQMNSTSKSVPEPQGQEPLDIKSHPVLIEFEISIDAAMKRLLAANDSYGTKVMREAILDELNKLRRLIIALSLKSLEWELMHSLKTWDNSGKNYTATRLPVK